MIWIRLYVVIKLVNFLFGFPLISSVLFIVHRGTRRLLGVVPLSPYTLCCAFVKPFSFLNRLNRLSEFFIGVHFFIFVLVFDIEEMYTSGFNYKKPWVIEAWRKSN